MLNKNIKFLALGFLALSISSSAMPMLKGDQETQEKDAPEVPAGLTLIAAQAHEIGYQAGLDFFNTTYWKEDILGVKSSGAMRSAISQAVDAFVKSDEIIAQIAELLGNPEAGKLNRIINSFCGEIITDAQSQLSREKDGSIRAYSRFLISIVSDLYKMATGRGH